MGNKLVFQPPDFDFSTLDNYNQQIIYIRKSLNQSKNEEYIPCFLIIEYDLSPNFLIYFHGNSEDIFTNELLGFHMAREFHMNIIIVEYKGYSIYKGNPDPQSILDDSLIVYDFILDFIKNNINFKEYKIFVCGRSLGTSPAIYLASEREIEALIVISAFESIKAVGNERYAGFLLPDIFKSINYISKVKCPTLFIHGKKDILISYSNSIKLFNACQSEIKSLILRESMTHNEIDFKKDIFQQINNFFKENKNNIQISNLKNCFNFEDENYKKMFKVPEYLEQYFEEKIFQISKFSKSKDIPYSNTPEICILPLINNCFIYSFDNNINLYKCISEENIKFQEKKYIIIKSLNYIYENKICYLTNEGHIKIYSFDFNKFIYINDIELESPKKIIVSEDNKIYVLGNKLYKINNPEKDEKGEQIIGKINEFPITIFFDIIEIRKNIFILSSANVLASINIENGEKNKIIEEDFSPIQNNNLHKLNENQFLLTKKSKMLVYDSALKLISSINNDDKFLKVLNEDKILLRDKNRKTVVRQYNLKKKSLESELRLSSNGHTIKSLYIMENKKAFIVVIKKIQIYLVYKNIQYSIEIWRKKNEERKKSTCALSSISS